MLTDADKLLLAAAMDGPSAAADRLLAGSPEACAFAAELAADRSGLAGLPQLTAPAGFADRVDARLPIIVPSVPLPTRQRAAWLPYVTAAGVCLAVVGVAYQFGGRREQPGPAVAVTPKSLVRPAPLTPGPPERLPMPRPADTAVVRQAPPAVELAPTPRAVEPPTLFAAGLFREIEPPVEVATRPPLLGAVGDLTAGDVASLWPTLPVARLDLFVSDTAAALPAVQAAGKACGWTVATDAAAQALLKAKQPGTFALYADGVSAADAAKFVGELAAQQRGGAKLGLAHLSAAGAADLRELKELFGDARPAAKDDSTVGQVVRQLASKRPALLFATAPPASRPTANSKDVRAFAAGRVEGKPGCVPLLVVVRLADGN